MRTAIFASGSGSNFEVLAQKFQAGEFKAELVLLFSDHPDAFVIKRAQKLKVPYETFTVRECGGKVLYEKRIMEILEKYRIDFIILAGYMRVLGEEIVLAYDKRIVNLHPAYLPEYQGLHAIERAFSDHQTQGKSQTGVTIHYVDTGLDTGPVILQKHVPIYPDDTLETLEQRIHACEHELYPQALKQIFKGE